MYACIVCAWINKISSFRFVVFHVHTTLQMQTTAFLRSDHVIDFLLCMYRIVFTVEISKSKSLFYSVLLHVVSGRAPKTVRLFINQTHTLDFDSAESHKPIQELK